MQITLNGMEDADKQMARIERGLAALKNYNSYVYSKLPYAHGIHEGRHRVSGKLARRAGGSFYIRRAVDDVLSNADRDLSEGLTKVTAPGVWVVRRLALWSRRLARQYAPRGPQKKSGGRNYRLWRSIKHEVRRN
jgi:hypothetical protein